MADSGRTDPFDGMISLVATPIAAGLRSFEQLRKGTDEMLRGVENFNTTMENLNETIARVNRMLNEFEEPIRAILPQITRTAKLAEELSHRLAGPVDQVAPGLARLADTLNSPVLTALPRDLGEFMTIINDLGRRMSPLTQLAEQAGGMFGLRIPGFSSRPSSPPSAPAASPAPVVESAPAPRAAKATSRNTTAKKATAKKSTAKKTPAKQASPRR